MPHAQTVVVEPIGPVSRWILQVILIVMCCYILAVELWQYRVIRGGNHQLVNPDGSVDDWHEQKLFYGLALADLILVLPITILAFVLWACQVQVALAHYIFSILAFWMVYCNTFSTATSLKFENPELDWDWFITFPFGIVLGSVYLAWVLAHFEQIFGHAPPELANGSGIMNGGGGGYTHVPDANAGGGGGDWWRH